MNLKMTTMLIALTFSLSVLGCVAPKPKVAVIAYQAQAEPICNKATIPDVEVRWTTVLDKDTTLSSHGSGSIVKVGESTYLFTAYHVVTKPGGTLSIYTKDGRIPATFGPMRVYSKGDVAVFPIYLLAVKIDPYTIKELDPNGQLIAKGYPGETKSLVAQKGGVERVSVETTCDIEPGMSGGGLIEDGKLVGIHTDKIITQGESAKAGRHSLASDVVRALGLK